ncbi:unnamed protein product, partial [Laminaria digitata]
YSVSNIADKSCSVRLYYNYTTVRIILLLPLRDLLCATLSKDETKIAVSKYRGEPCSNFPSPNHDLLRATFCQKANKTQNQPCTRYSVSSIAEESCPISI